MGEREVQELEKDVVDPWDLLLWSQYTEFEECVITDYLITNGAQFIHHQRCNVDAFLQVTSKTYHGIQVHGCCHGECFCIQVCIGSNTNQAYLHKPNFYDSDEDLMNTHPDPVHSQALHNLFDRYSSQEIDIHHYSNRSGCIQLQL